MLYRLALLFCLLAPAAALAQGPPPARPLLEYAGDHGLQIPLEHVIWYKHLDDDRLVLVGGRTYQLLDLKRAKIVESRPVTIPTLETHSRIDPAAEWVLRPDGRKMLVVGHREARDATKEREAGWVWDYAKAVPNPRGRLFLTYSKQSVQVFDSRTGELLQTVFAPSMDFSHVPPKIRRGGEELLKAGWSNDGRTLYILNGNRQTVELWSLP